MFQSPQNRGPTLGLGVTVPCRSTGLVATQQRRTIRGIPHEEGANDYPVSREIVAKNKVASRSGDADDVAIADLKATISQFTMIEPSDRSELNSEQHYLIPRDFDDFGRRNGSYSYLAVVHADGNGVGNIFRHFAQDLNQKLPNKRYIEVLNAFSKLVNTAGADAVNTMVDALAQGLKNEFKDLTTDLKRPIDQTDFRISRRKETMRDRTPYFPFRPLIYGGDDITFVCDARVAVAITELLIQSFEAHTTAHLQTYYGEYPEMQTHLGLDKLTACAGITIFKTHYPFARAYHLAEELCRSAKDFSQAIANKTISALDWQIAPSGRVYDLAELREHEYQSNQNVQNEWLTLRPVVLDSDRTWRTWANVKKALNEFASQWNERRNKLIAFQDVQRQGAHKTQQWLRNLETGLTLPEFAGIKRLATGEQTAWAEADGRSPIPHRSNPQPSYALYFDVIALLEHYYPFAESKGGHE